MRPSENLGFECGICISGKVDSNSGLDGGGVASSVALIPVGLAVSELIILRDLVIMGSRDVTLVLLASCPVETFKLSAPIGSCGVFPTWSDDICNPWRPIGPALDFWLAKSDSVFPSVMPPTFWDLGFRQFSISSAALCESLSFRFLTPSLGPAVGVSGEKFRRLIVSLLLPSIELTSDRGVQRPLSDLFGFNLLAFSLDVAYFAACLQEVHTSFELSPCRMGLLQVLTMHLVPDSGSSSQLADETIPVGTIVYYVRGFEWKGLVGPTRNLPSGWLTGGRLTGGRLTGSTWGRLPLPDGWRPT